MSLKLEKTYLSGKPGKTSVLVGVFALFSMMMLFWMDHDGLVASGSIIYQQHEWWRAFTTTLIHADFSHLGHNALFFTIFAILLNHYCGVFVFPVLSFLIGGVINLIVLAIYPPQVSLVGVSGVVYYMAAFWMTLFVLIERKQSLTRRLIIATAICLILLFPEVLDPKVSHLAHATGFFLGIPSGLIYFRMNREFILSHDVWREREPVWISEEEYLTIPHDPNEQV